MEEQQQPKESLSVSISQEGSLHRSRISNRKNYESSNQPQSEINPHQQCMNYYKRCNNASESQILQNIKELKQRSKIEVPGEYLQLSNMVKIYKANLVGKFQNRQQNLINQLQTQAIQLKKEIAFYSKETSKENIDFLIAKKRSQKEAERLSLEVQWRELNEKLKKLENQQKKLKDVNKESEFDLQSLQNKIKQLKIANNQLRSKIGRTKQKNQNFQYLTQFSRQPQGGLKGSTYQNNENKRKIWVSQNKCNKEDQNKCSQGNQGIKGNKEQKQIEIVQSENKKNINSRIISLKGSCDNSYEQLMSYLALPEIRDKIFQILLSQK